ncbi:MAG: hypothetical protein ACLPKE_04800 [Streptosporangiaceae bacterium]
MTTAAGHVATGPAAPAPSWAGGSGPAEAPRLAGGVELLGEYKDSGYGQPPSLVRRADGQVVQMSRLLYQVTCRIDGSRDPAAIAALVSEELGRALNADQVRYLVTARLLPLGIVAAEGAPAAAPKADPLLALRARGTLLPERAANAAGTLLRPLFRWPVVVAVAGTVLVMDYWLVAVHGLGSGLHQVLHNPVDLLIVLGLSVVSAAFHECGHAAGCRFGGARPGVIGVGIYLVWPSFFTNVTDSYRLSRAGRLRTDLGGLYFNLIFMLALAGIYSATSAEVLLLVIAITHLEMLEQLLPFVRFDGYFILSDLAGVPDLFARIAPILRSAVPSRAATKGRRDPRISGLKPRTRIVVTGWVLCVIPLLALSIGYLLLHFPQISRALWRSGSHQAHLLSVAVGGHRYAMAAVDAIGILLLALSLAGSLYILTGLARRLTALGLRWSAGRPGRRLPVAAAGLACVTALAAFWAGQGQFRGW